mgnify:CR=1 FL=1
MKSPYDVIVKPIITEKTMKMIEVEGCKYGKYTFEVAPGANKVEVKLAVEKVFNVEVKDVNIINVRKKQRRMGRYEGYCPAVRKAISLSIDKNNIVASCLGNGYTASNFSLDMGCWLYTKDLNTSIDTEQAAQILHSAGWERTAGNWIKRTESGTQKLEFSISVDTNNATRVAVVENIKNQLASFGIPITIQYLSPDNYSNAINNGNFDVIIILEVVLILILSFIIIASIYSKIKEEVIDYYIFFEE